MPHCGHTFGSIVWVVMLLAELREPRPALLTRDAGGGLGEGAGLWATPGLDVTLAERAGAVCPNMVGPTAIGLDTRTCGNTEFAEPIAGFEVTDGLDGARGIAGFDALPDVGAGIVFGGLRGICGPDAAGTAFIQLPCVPDARACG